MTKYTDKSYALLKCMIEARADWRNKKISTTEYEIEINDALNEALELLHNSGFKLTVLKR